MGVLNICHRPAYLQAQLENQIKSIFRSVNDQLGLCVMNHECVVYFREAMKDSAFWFLYLLIAVNINIQKSQASCKKQPGMCYVVLN